MSLDGPGPYASPREPAGRPLVPVVAGILTGAYSLLVGGLYALLLGGQALLDLEIGPGQPLMTPLELAADATCTVVTLLGLGVAVALVRGARRAWLLLATWGGVLLVAEAASVLAAVPRMGLGESACAGSPCFAWPLMCLALGGVLAARRGG